MIEDDYEYDSDIAMPEPEGETYTLAVRCDAKTDRHVCHLMHHPDIPVHVDLSKGWLEVWSTPQGSWKNRAAGPADPLQDAPEALRGP